MLSRKISSLLTGFETPFYLYDMELLGRTLDLLQAEAGKRNYIVHYAVKANHDPRLLRFIAARGLGADCVSGGEIEAAVAAGFDPRGIVFAGVGKSDREIRCALERGIFAFNCESREELAAIDSVAAAMGRTADVALRINPDVDPMTHRHISTGQADSKFGISYTEIGEVIRESASLRHVRICGLHFHIGSQIRDLRVFDYLCRRIVTLLGWFREQGINPSHVNVGGGLGINYASPEDEAVPDFAGYFGIFERLLPRELELHFELGRSIAGQCGELITRVLYNKTTAAGRRVTICDASMSQLLRPALYGARHAIENITPRSGGRVRVTVAGTACESADIFDRDIELLQPLRGDLLTIKSAGAYGMSMASRYNLHDLPAAVYSDEL